MNSSSWSPWILCYALPTYAHPGHVLYQQKQAWRWSLALALAFGYRQGAQLLVVKALMRRPLETPEEFCKHVGFPAKEK